MLKTKTDFGLAQKAIAAQWERMSKQNVFRVDVSGDDLWERYLAAFPPGTNEMFRKRAEHDCSCCRSFVRAMGNIIAIVDGRVVSLWDAPCEDRAFSTVFAALATLIKGRAISSPFLYFDQKAGQEKNFEQKPGEEVITWRHYVAKIPAALQMERADIPGAIGERRATRDVLERGLRELTMDALETVLDMIGQNSLYRGEEHRGAVERFRAIKVAFDALPEDGRDVYVWSIAATESPAICRIRNTAIGTLLIDLSQGTDLEEAVKKFEAVVAPTNYKRPTALVTKAMVEKARAKVAKLGLTESLERRHAVIEDLKVDDLLFVDRDTRAVINGDAFDLVSASAASRQSKELSGLEEVPVDRFVSEILPRAKSVEVLLENRHAGNMVSLIAPAHRESGRLFKWPNAFSWSYAGEVADSIKERVKSAGGSVVGDLCCRLAWYNYDDLDLHMGEPGGGHIFFGSKTGHASGGSLDVDMNAGAGTTREPVENIFYPTMRKMRPGEYRLAVNQYCNRDSKDPGFEVEIDALGTLHHFTHSGAMRTGQTVDVATIRVSKDGNIEVVSTLPVGSRGYASRKVWGIDTGHFHRVKAAMLSPNHWGESKVGNRHLFLMLEGCASDAASRGFYNEFLTQELDQHRKVLELVGSKAAIAPADRQLSGVGFSSTARAKFTARIKGSFNRTITVVI